MLHARALSERPPFSKVGTLGMLPRLNPTGIATRRQGFSLLEVLLALALSVVVIAIISAALRLHLLTLQNQRLDVERAQLSRAVLQMIAADLRSAIQYKPADVSSLEELAASQQAMLGMLSGLGSEEAQQPEPQDSPFSAEDNVPRPGIYGESDRITIDISRLPRLDQYLPAVTGAESDSLPTDIKTVTYFVSDRAPDQPAFAQSRFSQNDSDQSQGGLYRRQMDRAVVSYSLMYGSGLGSSGESELIAPEIIRLGFRYFDGGQWQDHWDSDLMGGFPSAIEITVVVDSRRADPAGGAWQATDPSDAASGLQRFRTVVFLPVAEIIPAEQ